MPHQYINELAHRRDKIFLDIGSGGRKGSKGWTTLDISNKADISWDLRKGVPFPDNSVDKIYSSHFLEHLQYPQAQKFLDECKRALVVDGMFSICVPNARLYIEAYMDPTIDISDFFTYTPAYNNTHSKMDYLNYIAYMADHHKFLFDEENLVNILSMKGFRKVALREFDPELDHPLRDYESIYAEAVK